MKNQIKNVESVVVDSGSVAADLAAQIAALQAENEALKAKANRTAKLTFKVSDKKAVSVYGLGRFPVTLYREQWERLIGVSADLTGFIAAHASELAIKGDAK